VRGDISWVMDGCQGKIRPLYLPKFIMACIVANISTSHGNAPSRRLPWQNITSPLNTAYLETTVYAPSVWRMISWPIINTSSMSLLSSLAPKALSNLRWMGNCCFPKMN